MGGGADIGGGEVFFTLYFISRGQNEGAKLRRRGEICFSKAAWRLTEIDGQLGIADINISNFLFTRSSMSDDR